MRKFGGYIRALRLSRNIGQRELARQLSMAPSYLNDIEYNRRKPPGKKTIQQIAEILEANLEYLYDLAGGLREGVPPDIPEILRKFPESSNLLRTIRELRISKEGIQKLIKTLEEDKMKAIIIAAGMGTRLKHFTEELPKCMLEFEGKTLLQHQLDALNVCGINDIVLIRGYKAEKINYPGIKYYHNDRYEKNNILNSLFYAEPEMDGELLISYSDILYEKEVLERLLKSEKDISIVVDLKWREYYKGRKEHPIEEAENVIIDPENRVVEIGKILTHKHDVHGEFIGMMKLSRRGTEIFKRNFSRAKQLFRGKPFQRAPSFEKAYLTDMLQDLVYIGVDVYCVMIERGWKEIDTVDDYMKAINEFEK